MYAHLAGKFVYISRTKPNISIQKSSYAPADLMCKIPLKSKDFISVTVRSASEMSTLLNHIFNSDTRNMLYPEFFLCVYIPKLVE